MLYLDAILETGLWNTPIWLGGSLQAYLCFLYPLLDYYRGEGVLILLYLDYLDPYYLDSCLLGLAYLACLFLDLLYLSLVSYLSY